MNAEAIAKALGGYNRNGKDHLCRCPVHDDHSPSLSLADGEDGRLLIKCFAGCDGKEVFRIIKSRGLLGNVIPQHRQVLRPEPVSQETRLDWSRRAESIYDKRHPLEGSLAAAYLMRRRCVMPETDDVFFLPVIDLSSFPRRCKDFPSMVAIIRDAVTGKPISLHFTFLAHDGSGKAPIPKNEQRHLLYGHRSGGGVIHLVDEGDISYGLGIAEGIETALSVMASGWKPIWSTISAGNMATFPIRGSSMSLTIFADHDESGTGLKAANKCAARWHAAGREVRIVMPKQVGSDWNG